jgi:hypothetical protein
MVELVDSLEKRRSGKSRRSWENCIKVGHKQMEWVHKDLVQQCNELSDSIKCRELTTSF